MTERFYEFWNYIVGISVIFGLLSSVVTLKSFFNTVERQSSNRENVKTSKTKRVIFFVLSVAFIFIALITWKYREDNRKTPSVVHMSLGNAQQRLSEEDLILDLAPGLEYDFTKEITSQSPAEGTIVKKGSKIVCKYDDDSSIESDLSENSNTDIAVVPDVIDMEQTEAINAIHQSGLEFKVWWTNDGTFIDNEGCYVLEQDPVQGSEVEAGSVVKIKLTGKKPAKIKHFSIENEPSDMREEYYIVFDDAVTNPVKVNSITDEVTYPTPDEVINERLVHVTVSSSNIDVSNAFISISDGVATGVLLCTDDGLPSFSITPGIYQILADFGNETKTTQLELFKDGEYALVFE